MTSVLSRSSILREFFEDETWFANGPGSSLWEVVIPTPPRVCLIVDDQVLNPFQVRRVVAFVPSRAYGDELELRGLTVLLDMDMARKAEESERADLEHIGHWPGCSGGGQNVNCPFGAACSSASSSRAASGYLVRTQS